MMLNTKKMLKIEISMKYKGYFFILLFVFNFGLCVQVCMPTSYNMGNYDLTVF